MRSHSGTGTFAIAFMRGKAPERKRKACRASCLLCPEPFGHGLRPNGHALAFGDAARTEDARYRR